MFWSSFFSESWPLHIGIDLALAIFLSATVPIRTKSEVAMITPVCTPRILDQPVLTATFLFAFAVPNDGDRVIDIGPVRVAAIAVAIVHNAPTVPGQAAKVRVNGDTNRVLCDKFT